MSFTQTSLQNVAKKQYLFKLKANIGASSALIIAQVSAILFSLIGGGMMGSSSDGLSISVSNFSGNVIIAFTMIWAFIIAFTLTTKTFRNTDFSFVSNRLSSQLANIAFILTFSVLGGISAMLCGVLLKVSVFFVLGSEDVLLEYVGLTQLLSGILVASSYIVLCAAAGYFMGTLIQLSKLFIIIIPAFIIGPIFLGQNNPIEMLFTAIVQFFAGEGSLLLFLLKVLLTITLLFISATLVSNRIKVRQ